MQEESSHAQGNVGVENEAPWYRGAGSNLSCAILEGTARTLAPVGFTHPHTGRAVHGAIVVGRARDPDSRTVGGDFLCVYTRSGAQASACGAGVVGPGRGRFRPHDLGAP